jgi:hypothetical protein
MKTRWDVWEIHLNWSRHMPKGLICSSPLRRDYHPPWAGSSTLLSKQAGVENALQGKTK